MIIGREQAIRCGRVFQFFAYAQALPEFIRRRECFEMPLLASDKVELDNAMPIGRIGEFEIENRGIFLRLLQTALIDLYAALASTTAITKSRV
jgi:hypothetical protein